MAAGKMSGRQQETKRKKKLIVFVIEIVVILIMLGVLLWLVTRNPDSGPSRVILPPPTELGINQQIQLEKESGESPLLGYMNIALFGVDAKKDKELFKGSRSDTIMIASVNLDTGDIKLVSVYRDTLLNLSNDSYQKCNAAYSYGGAEQAVKMLNMNLDLDIETFVTVGYKGLSQVVDGLGGVWIDIDSEELEHINNYQIDVAEVLKCDYIPVKTTGYQKLNGVQATAYCRIRYTNGNDFMRTTRQREVLKAIEKEAKNTDLVTLTKVFNAVFKDDIIYTNISNTQIMELIENISKYSIVDEDGFPQAKLRTVETIDVLRGNQVGSAVIPTSLEDNVVWLHKFLFENEDYTVTKSVSDISKTIATETAPFIEK